MRLSSLRANNGALGIPRAVEAGELDEKVAREIVE
jgi:hypothetical protein